MNGAGSDDAVTLGIIAGGRGSRLGGCDKAWLRRDGRSQIERLLERFGGQCDSVMVNANRDLPRYRSLPVIVVPDRTADLGPIAGLEALAAVCRSPWLLTMPVDLVDANDCLLPSLRAAGSDGAAIADLDGPQPLVALWPVAALRRVLPTRIAAGDYAVQGLQRALGMSTVTLAGVRLGNLNTPADLAAAGIELE